MIKAILTTTNTTEPWAALVPFEIDGTKWSTKLKTKYQHYKNLEKNSRSVIVFTKEGLELIMKADSSLELLNSDEDIARFSIEWLRVVTAEGVRDFDQDKEIQQEIQKYI